MAIRAYSDEEYEVARLASENLGVPCSVVTYVDEKTQKEYELLKFGDRYWYEIDHLFTQLYEALGYSRPIPLPADKASQILGTSAYFQDWKESGGKKRQSLMVGPFPWADIAEIFGEVYLDDAAANDKPNTLMEKIRKRLVSEIEIDGQLQIIEYLKKRESKINEEIKDPAHALSSALVNKMCALYSTQFLSYIQKSDPSLRQACDESEICPFSSNCCAFCSDFSGERTAGSTADKDVFDVFTSSNVTFTPREATSSQNPTVTQHSASFDVSADKALSLIALFDLFSASICRTPDTDKPRGPGTHKRAGASARGDPREGVMRKLS